MILPELYLDAPKCQLRLTPLQQEVGPFSLGAILIVCFHRNQVLNICCLVNSAHLRVTVDSSLSSLQSGLCITRLQQALSQLLVQRCLARVFSKCFLKQVCGKPVVASLCRTACAQLHVATIWALQCDTYRHTLQSNKSCCLCECEI